MDPLYYLCIILLALGIPSLVIYFIAALIKPNMLNRRTKKDWSRGKILGAGTATIFAAIMTLGFGINGTMPQGVRADIEARNAATKELRANEQKKAQIQQAPEAETSEVKTETVKSSVVFATIEKTDATLSSGQRKVTTVGVAGERTETYEVTYVNQKQTTKRLTKSEITKVPVDEIISVGTYVAPRSSTPAPKTTSPTPTPSDSGSSAYYANCATARSAGVTPIYRGQPGYRSGLDRDNDGVACE